MLIKGKQTRYHYHKACATYCTPSVWEPTPGEWYIWCNSLIFSESKDEKLLRLRLGHAL